MIRYNRFNKRTKRQTMPVIFLISLILCFTGTGLAQIKNGERQPVPLVSIPFEIVEGSIIVSLKLNKNDRPLRMLFDTGADGMALLKNIADSLGIVATGTRSASVVGGNTTIGISSGNTVSFGDFSIPGLKVALFDKIRKGIDGILGNVICKKYITSIDYDRKVMSLYAPDNFEYPKGGVAVPIEVSSSVYLIEGKLSLTPDTPVSGRFVFDTGASYSLICFRPFVLKNRLLVSGFRPESQGATTSMGISTPTFKGSAFSFGLTGLPAMKNIPVALMASNGQDQSWQPGVDGSIGIGLIGKYNFTVNAFKKEIYLSKRSM